MGCKTHNQDNEPDQKWETNTGKMDRRGNRIHIQEQRRCWRMQELQTDMPNANNIQNTVWTHRKKTHQDYAYTNK